MNGKSCTALGIESGKDDGRDEHILKRQRQATWSSITRETATDDESWKREDGGQMIATKIAEENGQQSIVVSIKTRREYKVDRRRLLGGDLASAMKR